MEDDHRTDGQSNSLTPLQMFLWEMWNLTKADYCTDGDRNSLHSYVAVPLGDVEPYKR
jgi:hypothetical protein